jgi:glycosyltransferase involved in cell wall biosynthesis
LIAFNEEKTLEAALRSVSFCDEIVLVDSGSSDRTCAIASRRGAA